MARSILPAGTPLEDRLEFFSVPEPNSGCVLWTGKISRGGYGQIKVAGRFEYPHRLSYQRLYGPIPLGLTVDHLCRTRACINPRHMEIVGIAENVLRGTSPSAINRRKIACVKGHPFDAENTGYLAGGRVRYCRTCTRAVQDSWRLRHGRPLPVNRQRRGPRGPYRPRITNRLTCGGVSAEMSPNGQ